MERRKGKAGENKGFRLGERRVRLREGREKIKRRKGFLLGK